MDEAIDFLRRWREEHFPVEVRGGFAKDHDWTVAQDLVWSVLGQALGENAASNFRQEAANLRLLRDRIPDPNREPMSHWQLVASKIMTETAAQRLGYDSPSVLLDILPIGSVNALTLRVDRSNDYIVLIHSGLRTFSSLVTKVVAGAWRTLPRNLLDFDEIPDYFQVHAAISGKPELLRQFARIMLGVLVEGQPTGAAWHALQELRPDPFTATLEMASDIFMLGHEYAHFLEGHLDYRAAPESGIHVWLIDGTPVEVDDEVRKRWNEECHADEIGLRLLLEVAQRLRWDFDVAYAGVDIFLSCVDCLQKGRNIILRGNTDVPASPMHPPTYTRRDRLRKRVRETMPKEVADLLVRVGKLAEYVVKVLFDDTRKFLLMEHVGKSGLAAQFREDGMDS